MRKITTLFFLTTFTLVSTILKAQNSELNMEIEISKNVLSGYELLEEITEQTELKFSYSESIINIPSKIKLLKTTGSIQFFLDELFKRQNVEFIIKQKTIFIKLDLYETKLESEIINIKGKIIDKKTNKVIPFASISLCNHSIGLASNEFGEFNLKIPGSLKDENICINVLGYTGYNQKINHFLNEDYHIFKLEPTTYDIKEVSINKKRKRKFNDPKEIVQLALENIEKNYPGDPFILQGYYREYLKHDYANYLNMFEAAVVLKEKGFNTDFFPYNALLLQARYNQNFKLIEDLHTTFKDIPKHNIPPYGGNEFSVLFAHNAIRRQNKVTYSFVYKFREDFILNHTFKLDSIIYSEDIPIYCLSFKSNLNNFEYRDVKTSMETVNFEYKNGKVFEYNRKANIHGKILIRSNNWAIKRLEYCSFSTKEPKKKIYEIIVDYKNRNDKMYLNYLSFSNFYKVLMHPQRSNDLNIPIEEQPLVIKEIIVETDTLTLRLNRELRKWTCSRNDFKFDGYVIDNRSLIPDTIILAKKPEDVKIINQNTIKLAIPYIQYLLTDFEKTDIEISDSDTLEYGKATVQNNKILMGNICLTIDKLKDRSGFRLNELYSVDMYQHREFFVNDIPDSLTKNSYSRIIFNDLPLYRQLPKSINNFWDSFNYPVSMPLSEN